MHTLHITRSMLQGIEKNSHMYKHTHMHRVSWDVGRQIWGERCRMHTLSSVTAEQQLKLVRFWSSCYGTVS